MQIDGFKDKAEAVAWLKRHKGCRTVKEAEKYLYRHLPKESYYQGKIIRFIKENYPGAYVLKVAQGPYSKGGFPDICAIIKGRYYGFEVKRPYIGKPSELQLKTVRQIRAAGGIAEFVSYVSEVAEIIEKSLREADDV